MPFHLLVYFVYIILVAATCPAVRRENSRGQVIDGLQGMLASLCQELEQKQEKEMQQGNSCRSGTGQSFIPNIVKSLLSVLFSGLK